MRVFAISDVHVDHPLNLLWFRFLRDTDYRNDALILAGDVSDDLERMKSFLSVLRDKFAEVFFVPGNHELWIRRKECSDSVVKFKLILEFCRSLDIRCEASQLAAGDRNSAWVVPLFSWYISPEESARGLYVERTNENPDLSIWNDYQYITWPAFAEHVTAADYFLAMNLGSINKTYDAPVISFSHFLPRRELMFSDTYKPNNSPLKPPGFNFSRVAGCIGLDEQIRKLRSKIHVYGHQHRNRHCEIDGVLYISHCLGYPFERSQNQIVGIDDGPKFIWDTSRTP